MIRFALTAAVLAATALPATAQDHAHGHRHPAAGAGHGSAYAGMQHRNIKALSDQHVEGLRSGRGMGLAMAAELNGYPGPMHVLELAEPLKLTDTQLARTRQLYADMLAQAKAAGEDVIAAEQALDALFQRKAANAEQLSSAVAKAASAQGKLRETHLRYHLTMMDVLSPEQVAAYNKLRGY